MKLLFAAVAATLLFAGVSLAEVVLGTGAVSQSSTENGFSTLGGAGSIGNGLALSGSAVNASNRSAGFGIGGTIGLLSGAATGTDTSEEANTANFSASAGQAGAFSGAAAAGQGGSAAFAFGGLGVFLP